MPIFAEYTGYAQLELYECDRCNLSFYDDYDLREHEHTSRRHNICAICNLDFATALSLKEHYVQSPRHAFCQRCNQHFQSQAALQDHCKAVHYYCDICNKASRIWSAPQSSTHLTPFQQILDFELGLHEHRRQKHPDRYCVSCKRTFDSANNLAAHLLSATHAGQTVRCPGKACGRAFVSYSALILQLEGGTCPSRVTRAMIDRAVSDADRGGFITNPNRLIGGGSVSAQGGGGVTAMWATEHAWNGAGYECYLCHRTYGSLNALNQHLKSPAHAEKLYRCPAGGYGCGAEFGTLSGLWQHMESERCNVRRFRAQLEGVVEDSLARGMRMLGAS
ncbi:hypothetical protein C8Q80DRAFT_1108110 [Daedaleopsis nitida]|nr:hypothetical protein C8Q80DRAFT_1108110 [Daedaleopsis nitida]